MQHSCRKGICGEPKDRKLKLKEEREVGRDLGEAGRKEGGRNQGAVALTVGLVPRRIVPE